MGAQKRKHRSKSNHKKDSTDCAPPSKKQRTNHTNKPSLTSSNKSKKRRNIQMFLQLSNFTEQQISNILSNTKKGIDRPLVLFTDNDQDQFFLRVASIDGKIKIKDRQFSDDLFDANAQILHKYENWFSDNYLSFGIITDFKDKEMYEDEDKFRVNIDSNFKTLRNVVDTLKIKEIIVPCHYNHTKRINADHKYIFWGPNLSKHHLEYIQHKFNEFKILYNIKSIKALFTEHQILYGDDVEMNNIDIINESKQKRDTQKWLQKQEENETKTKEKNKSEKRYESKQEAEEEKVPHLTPATGPIIHSLRDKTVSLSSTNSDTHDANETYQIQNSEYTQLLMQRIEEQNDVIAHQQNELRVAKQMMNEYNIRRFLGRVQNTAHRRWNKVYFMSTCISVCCVLCIFGLIATSSMHFNVFKYIQISSIIIPSSKTIESVQNILQSIWFFVSFIICYFVLHRTRNPSANNLMNIENMHHVYKKPHFTILKCGICSIVLVISAIASFFTRPYLYAIVSPIAHIIDMDQVTAATISTNAQFVQKDPNYIWYICAIFVWFMIIAVLSPKISRNPWQAFFVMSLGPPMMFVSMYCASCMVLTLFYSNNKDIMSHEERLAVLWWFICVCLLPIVVIAICIGHIIQIASKSVLENIVNWKSFGRLVLSMIVMYTMMNHFYLTVYAFVVFGILYMIVQCFVVSRVDNSNNNKRANESKRSMDGGTATFGTPYAGRRYRLNQ